VSESEKGPCMHCMFGRTLKMLIVMFPEKECAVITQELIEFVAEYIASTAPAGECESAIKICQERLGEQVRRCRTEYVKAGFVKEATVQ
jgi:hypothetical protein